MEEKRQNFGVYANTGKDFTQFKTFETFEEALLWSKILKGLVIITEMDADYGGDTSVVYQKMQ